MALVVFFLIYTSALAAWAGSRQWRRAHDPAVPPAPRRLSHRQLAEFGARQLLFTAVLWLGFRSGGWTGASVGIPAQLRWAETILAGELGFLAVLVANLVLVSPPAASGRCGWRRRAATCVSGRAAARPNGSRRSSSWSSTPSSKSW